MAEPVNLFLASSNEGRPIAEALQLELAHDCVSQGWWSLFDNKPGATNLEQLLDLLHFNFAVMLLTRDDRIWHRKKGFDAPRDNLIFELGLFMGAMGGPERVFFVLPRDMEPTRDVSAYRIPSDLAAISGIEYDGRLSVNSTLQERRSAMSPVATIIRDQIHRLGNRITVPAVTPVGVSLNIIFHPNVQYGKNHLRFRVGYTGEGLLLRR